MDANYAKNVYLRTSLRRPLQTVLLMLLIAVLSYISIMRVVEYQAAREETARIDRNNKAIGYLVFQGNIEDWDDEARFILIDTITASQYVSYEDRRIYANAVMRDVQNDGYYGHLRSVYEEHGIYQMDVYMYISIRAGIYDDKGRLIGYWIEADRIEAGYEDNATTEGWMRIMLSSEYLGEIADFESLAEEMVIDNRYFVRAVAITGDYPVYERTLFFRPLMDREEILFLPAPPGSLIDSENPRLQLLFQRMDILRDSIHRIPLKATIDMAEIPAFAYVSLGITGRGQRLLEGRMLTAEDRESLKPLCVIHDDLATTRGLKVGEVLKVDVLLENQHGSYFNISNLEYRQGIETVYMEYEIVGIYNYTFHNRGLVLGNNSIYVPDTFLPSTQWPWYPDVTDFSFVLHSTRDMEAFRRENEELFAEYGYAIAYVNSQAGAVITAADEWAASVSVNLWLSCIYLLPAIALAVFLFHFRHRRELAILRSIGSPAKREIRNLLAVFSFMSCISVSAGGMIGWIHVTEEANRMLETIDPSAGMQLSHLISPYMLPMICGGLVVLLMLTAGVAYATAARRHPVNLLQSGTHIDKVHHKLFKKDKHNELPIVTGTINIKSVPSKHFIEKRYAKSNNIATDMKSKKSIACSLRYSFILVKRRTAKAMLSLLLALIYVILMGWIHGGLAYGRAQINDLYSTFEIKAEISIGEASMQLAGISYFIWPQIVNHIMDSGFIQGAYLVASVLNSNAAMFEVSATYYNEAVEVSVIGISRAERRLDNYLLGLGIIEETELGEGVHRVFYEGYNEQMFEQGWYETIPVTLTEELMQSQGIVLGDEIKLYITTDEGIAVITAIAAGSYSNLNNEYEVLMPLSSFVNMVESYKARYIYLTAEFELIPEMNKELALFKEHFISNIGLSANPVPLKLDVYDGELKNTVEPMERNVDFLETLYPLMLAAGMAALAVLAYIITLQRAKEGAVLRVLGNSSGRVSAMLGIGQLLPCAAGAAIGFIGMALLPTASGATAKQLLLCAVLSLAATAAGTLAPAVAMTAKMPLSLLQEDG